MAFAYSNSAEYLPRRLGIEEGTSSIFRIAAHSHVKKIVIIGAGFAGVWSALAARRLSKLTERETEIDIVVIAPKPFLVIRPRLYEANASGMTHSVEALFKDSKIEFIPGTVDKINAQDNTVLVRSISGDASTVGYDRLILAAGSSVVRPKSISGIQQHAFDIDSFDSAVKLESHLQNLTSLPSSPARNTVVVCGAGFTGIELATELPKRLPKDLNARIVMVESADQLGPELGPGPRPIITQALNELGIEFKLGSPVTAIDADGVTLASGERIETKTAIWTAGQIPAPRDGLSRLHVGQNLRVSSVGNIFATGDAAYATADTNGHFALMSCQHALPMGRVSGHNAAADLLGESLMPYEQTSYNCCLDLGAWGTVISEGWIREVKLTGDLAKRVKCFINQRLIYPPTDVAEAFTMANPTGPDSDQLFEQILQAVA
ncbi:hypothetical protein N7532_008453 [Penicillium argentinense]|uniref:FAD/NAD(P)-binding domain-containing protein n=1 Tax=Penicillium argentinense TaxID=1131581 RepID=A0A9W9EXL5_9EURO|nr:uncharacterized protein N7532_008453 [Penicillium argentinense]KAJ5089769.1 hypothetical protein N7532_008453 [Penicillium argentinense]